MSMAPMTDFVKNSRAGQLSCQLVVLYHFEFFFQVFHPRNQMHLEKRKTILYTIIDSIGGQEGKGL